jgi:hypothetical protein
MKPKRNLLAGVTFLVTLGALIAKLDQGTIWPRSK